MNFEDFRQGLEMLIEQIDSFDLQEYSYQPYSFGSGMIAFRFRGTNYKLEHDGREKDVLISESCPHEKYFGANFRGVRRIYGFPETLDFLKQHLSK